jgi:hypothetical protein
MRRRLPVLLLLYVALDFANPLMPGAVRFDAGSIEVVQADRTARAARPAAPSARLIVAFPKCNVVPTGATLDRPVASPPPVSILAVRNVRRPPQQRLAAPPPPSEDH